MRKALVGVCGFTILVSAWLFTMYFVLRHPGNPVTLGLQQPWFKNYKFHAFPYPNFKFYKTDPNWESKTR